MKKRPSLTDRQLDVFNALNAFIEENDRIPTHDQLADVIGVGRTAITTHMASLEEKGYIRRSRRWHDLDILTEDEGAVVTAEWHSRNQDACAIPSTTTDVSFATTKCDFGDIEGDEA